MDTGTELSKLADRLAIQDVMIGYAVAIDSQDWEALRSCFTEDCEVKYEVGPTVHGPQGIVDDMMDQRDALDNWFHLVGNFVIEVDGDSATARTYVIGAHVFHAAMGSPVWHVGGIYDDGLVRTADGWKIATRAATLRWTDGNFVLPQARAARDQ